jgi:type IV fimbrial biogenesis protein FimT
MRFFVRGFTIIELMIAVTLVAVIMAIAAPSLAAWLQNAQIRTASEAIQSGLQVARTEAVRRNSTVRFQMVTDISSACALSTASGNWVVSVADPTAACNVSPSDTTAPRIIQVRANQEGSEKAVIAATQAVIGFNSLGRQVSVTNADGTTTANPPVAVTINVTNPTGGNCKVASGPMRCMQIQVSAGGQIRMCDPSIANNDPRGC